MLRPSTPPGDLFPLVQEPKEWEAGWPTWEMIKGGTLLRSRDVILLILYQSPSCRQGNLILVTRTYNISTVYFLPTDLGSGTMGKIIVGSCRNGGVATLSKHPGALC